MKKRITSETKKKYTEKRKIMIIMDLKVNNFFAFRNFHLNMSYPKKIVDSYIAHEFLIGRENFRYKKVNILMGGNATGKTSIGQMLMAILNFINRKESIGLTERISNIAEEASFSIDFVGDTYKMYRVNVKILPAQDTSDNYIVKACTRSVVITKQDKYETCAKKIESLPFEYNRDYVEELEKIEEPLGWMFTYPADSFNNKFSCARTHNYLEILDYSLRALDPAIKYVKRLNEVDDTYVIHTDSKDLIIQDGKVILSNILSSGTKAGIDIANIIAEIYEDNYGFYYCDEKFSFIHSDLEKAFLNVMIEGLKDNSQLFFTTHNSDVLDSPYPKHTYTFLKKDVNDESQPIKCVYASDYLKRNTDSIHNAIDNDLFSISPDVDLVYKIAEIGQKL